MPLAAKGDPVWVEIASHILPAELHRPYEMDADFLRKLHLIRLDSKVPFRFLSDARDPADDIGAKQSAHEERPCAAVDLKVKNAYERWMLVSTAIKHDIKRIGIYPGKKTPMGNDVGSIHLDDSKVNPSPRIWTRY